MFHSKPRKPRPLGSIHSINGPLQIKSLNIPNILPGINADTDKSQQDIQRSVLTVPPQQDIQRSVLTVPPQQNPVKESSPLFICDKCKPVESTTHPPKVASDNTISHESCNRKINQSLIHEKDLKNQIELLSKQLEQLRVTLCSKEEGIKLLKEQLAAQETQYMAQLNEERSGHEMARFTLSETRNQIVEAHRRSQRLTDEHKEEMKWQKEESEKHLMGRLAEKDSIIADRDQKMSRLKSQMADALKGNSRERQQQLDELTKELSRINEECDMLRTKLKSMSVNKQAQCSSCEENSKKVLQLQAAIKDKNITIKELESLCGKFESQLSTQDKLLEQWAVSKGHKIYAPK